MRHQTLDEKATNARKIARTRRQEIQHNSVASRKMQVMAASADASTANEDKHVTSVNQTGAFREQLESSMQVVNRGDTVQNPQQPENGDQQKSSPAPVTLQLPEENGSEAQMSEEMLRQERLRRKQQRQQEFRVLQAKIQDQRLLQNPEINSSPETSEQRRCSPGFRKCASWSTMTQSTSGVPLATSTPAHPIRTVTPVVGWTMPSLAPGGKDPGLAPKGTAKDSLLSGGSIVAEAPVTPINNVPVSEAGCELRTGGGDLAGVDVNVLVDENDFDEIEFLSQICTQAANKDKAKRTDTDDSESAKRRKVADGLSEENKRSAL